MNNIILKAGRNFQAYIKNLQMLGECNHPKKEEPPK
jgi:hypothetical protein